MLSFKPEQILDLTEEEKVEAFPPSVEGDVIRAIVRLQSLGRLNLAYDPFKIVGLDSELLRRIYWMDDTALLKEVGSASLTRGQAIMKAYRRELCEQQTGDVTFITTQRFIVPRDKIRCDDTLGELSFYGNTVYVNPDMYNSEEFAKLLEARKRELPVKGSITNKLYEGYLQAISNEVEMRDKMYKKGADPKFFGPYYDLSTRFLEPLPKEEGFDQGLLFANKKLKKRDDAETNAYFDLFDRIIANNKHITIAGGAVFTALFKNILQDIDVFLTTKHEYTAEWLVRDLIQRCKPSRITRTANSITLLQCFRKPFVRYPGPRGVKNSPLEMKTAGVKIQIILRLYNSLSEVLHGFDIDSSCIGYDRTKIVRMTPRCQYALQHGINFVNFDRLSPTYEIRLLKYANRGMSIYVPDFNPDAVQKDLLNKDWRVKKIQDIGKDIQGLSLLLIANKRAENKKGFLHFLGYMNDWSDYSDTAATHTGYGVSVNDLAIKLDSSVEDLPSIEINWSFMHHLMYRAIMRRFPSEERPENPVLSYVSITGGDWIKHLDEVLTVPKEVRRFLEQKFTFTQQLPWSVEWKTTKPGEQMTNTFHKIVLENNSSWYNGVYYQEGTESGELELAIRSSDRFDEETESMEDDDVYDALLYLLRAAETQEDKNEGLKLAAKVGALEFVKEFIDVGADQIDLAIGAAANGNHKEIIEYLISQDADDWYIGLYGAAVGGHRNLVNFFIKKGNVNWDYALMGAAKGGHIDLIDFFIAGGATELKGAIEEALKAGQIKAAGHLAKQLSQ